MQIPSGSGFYQAQVGLQQSLKTLDQASQNVANAGAAHQNTTVAESTENHDTTVREGLVAANVSELNAQANTNVLAAADEMLGTLIDIKA